MFVLNAFDAVKEAIFEILVSAKTDYSRRRVNGQTYKGTKYQKYFQQH